MITDRPVNPRKTPVNSAANTTMELRIIGSLAEDPNIKRVMIQGTL